jgi:hypothetical protein
MVKRVVYALFISFMTMGANLAHAEVKYLGIGGYDKTASNEVIRTPFETISRGTPDSPIYVTSSFKVHVTPTGSYYGGWWMGLGVAVGNKIKPFAEASYDIGSLIWNGANGIPLSETDGYTAYGIRLEGENMAIAFYKRYYYFGNSVLSTKTGLVGEHEFTGFTIYFRTR